MQPSIMLPALSNLKRLRVVFAGNAIDKPVLPGDAAGPPTGPIMPKRLGFSDAGEWRPAAVFNKAVETLQGLAVLLDPFDIIVPTLGQERQFHFATSSRSSDLPASASASRIV